MSDTQADNYFMFLEQVAAGAASGTFDEWIQLRAACKWAAAELERLRGVEEKLRDACRAVVGDDSEMGAAKLVGVSAIAKCVVALRSTREAAEQAKEAADDAE